MVTEAIAIESPALAIDAIVHKHNVEPGAVIPILQEIQEAYGHVPPIAIQRVAEHMNIPASEIYGIVTFYAQFRLQPLGKNLIRVCHGTACHLGGAEMVAETLNNETHGRLTPESVDKLVAEMRKQEAPTPA
jgi:NADH-quinone oxidoreductase subunit E